MNRQTDGTAILSISRYRHSFARGRAIEVTAE